ncbi:MAG: endonuclease/exonuclease/phosphatase family protein [Phycisphaeraceae bacterium]
MHTCFFTMKPNFAVVFLLLLAPLASADEVTVMSYNVENMFDVFDDPYTGDEGTDVKRRDEILAIAKAIAKADADVIVFQELENEHLLAGMVKTFLADKGYEYIAAQRTNSTRGINLGVVSRYPIKRIASYRFRTLTHPDAPGETWRFARDAMHVTLEIKGTELHVFNVHLKSNSSRPNDKNSMKWRSAEVLGVKSIVRELLNDNPDAYVLLMGDCNSNIETRPEQPRPWPATQLMRAPEEDGSRLLIDVFDGMAYDDRVTIMA